MKHIEKRFLNEMSIGKDVANLLNDLPPVLVNESSDIKNLPDNCVPYFITHDDKFYQAFQFKVDGKIRIIPEPDPILLYFHTAYVNYRNLGDAKDKLLKLTEVTLGKEPAINELYEYFGMVSCVIIFLFTTIEATMNRCIPMTYTYRRETKNKTELYTKNQIEQVISFDDKLKFVLTDVTKKNFEKAHPLMYKHIQNLKSFRNDIVHTKSNAQGNEPEKHNYNRAFKFDYDKTIEAVKEFCNFYIRPDFIIDCPCSKNW